MNRYRIGKVYISSTCPDDALKKIEQAIKDEINHYICVSNVRTVAFANKNANKDYCELMNNAFMCLPDGMPLVWMARLWGLRDVHRTVGPDLLTSMLNNKESGIRHFLLGDTEEVLAQMKEKYESNGANIVGTYSPPFCDLDEFNYTSIARMINDSNADIVWLSLRAPKQDFFAVRLLPYLNKKICIGVGAAFRFSLGQIKHPPKIIMKLGLTGLFWRKINTTMIKWMIINSFMLCYWGLDIILSRITGKINN